MKNNKSFLLYSKNVLPIFSLYFFYSSIKYNFFYLLYFKSEYFSWKYKTRYLDFLVIIFILSFFIIAYKSLSHLNNKYLGRERSQDNFFIDGFLLSLKIHFIFSLGLYIAVLLDDITTIGAIENTWLMIIFLNYYVIIIVFINNLFGRLKNSAGILFGSLISPIIIIIAIFIFSGTMAE